MANKRAIHASHISVVKLINLHSWSLLWNVLLDVVSVSIVVWSFTRRGKNRIFNNNTKEERAVVGVGDPFVCANLKFRKIERSPCRLLRSVSERYRVSPPPFISGGIECHVFRRKTSVKLHALSRHERGAATAVIKPHCAPRVVAIQRRHCACGGDGDSDGPDQRCRRRRKWQNNVHRACVWYIPRADSRNCGCYQVTMNRPWPLCVATTHTRTRVTNQHNTHTRSHTSIIILAVLLRFSFCTRIRRRRRRRRPSVHTV